MQFAVLSSGSKANCTYVQNNDDAFLIDCGLSARMALYRLELIEADYKKIRGIILTHEHRDHTAGITVLAKKLNVPVYTNAETAAVLDMFNKLENVSTKMFKTGHSFQLASFKIKPFAISHDAAAPCGFEIFCDGQKLVYVTDLGKVTTLVQNSCCDCNGLILEFNHDENMLWNCDYPWQLKQRIASNHGHLSNENAAKLVQKIFHSELKHLILGHISENSNTPETALKTLEQYIDTSLLYTCRCANPYTPTPLMDLHEDEISQDVAASA